jgi:hypothetical protein
MTAAAPTAKGLSLLAFAASLGVAVFAGSASGHATSVRFIAGPSRVVQGNEATMTIAVAPGKGRCSLSVRYKSGARQKGLPSVPAASGTATWTWTVPRRVQPGGARATASCPAGRATKAFTVIGQVLPPKLDVVKSGWSTRPYPFGGTGVSYGVILANRSKTSDALDVSVLVNFVMEDNRLIGSASSHVSDIAAGTEHAVGGELTFPAGAPIARLELTVQIGKTGSVTHTKPGISAIRVLPGTFEPQWCGSVEGEIQNDNPRRTLQFVELSTVVFDASGNIIGGGSGFGLASLPPSARMFMKITSGMGPIPYYKAASAMVSVVPIYKSEGL